MWLVATGCSALLCFELWSGLYFALFSGFLSSADSWPSGRWLVGISQDPGERNPVERWEKSNSHSSWNVSSLWQETNYELLRFYTLFFRENTLFLLTAKRKWQEEKKFFSAFNSILLVVVSATGRSVLPQFLARKDYCECHTCLALSQVQFELPLPHTLSYLISSTFFSNPAIFN